MLALRTPRAGARGRRPRRSESRKKREKDEIDIPPAVAKAGRAALTEVQHWFYHQVLEPTFTGRAHVPNHTNYLVVANHSSHLDMGLVKMALGDGGSNLVALAAADYFFDNRVKRTFFGNFTGLVPDGTPGPSSRIVGPGRGLSEAGLQRARVSRRDEIAKRSHSGIPAGFRAPGFPVPGWCVADPPRYLGSLSPGCSRPPFANGGGPDRTVPFP